MKPLQQFIYRLSQKISSKYFVSLGLKIGIIFLIYHAIVWSLYTSKLLDVQNPYHVGDLARIGYQPSSIYYRKTIDTLPKKHIEFSQWHGESIDILTIGDSFSNGGAGGKNSFYQDYIASKYNYNVMNINIPMFDDNYLEAIVNLYNSGLLDAIKPKAILIESVGRYVPARFSNSIQWDKNSSNKTLYNNLIHGKWGDGKPQKQEIHFVTTANYKLPLYNLYYKFSPNAFHYSEVYKIPLFKSLFNVQAGSTLLIYDQDISCAKNITQKNVFNANQNLNHLAAILKSKDINLFVMIAVDKYDLYYDYIVDKSYPKNSLFNLIRPMEKQYKFVDTKAILTEQLMKEKKDVYYADDTHWSNIASEAIANSEVFKRVNK